MRRFHDYHITPPSTTKTIQRPTFAINASDDNRVVWLALCGPLSQVWWKYVWRRCRARFICQAMVIRYDRPPSPSPDNYR
jgi:hypothetical protein